MVGKDTIIGMGFIGLEHGRLYNMRRGPNVITATITGRRIVLEKCAGGKLRGLILYGKSTQVTTTGTQLIDINSFQKDNSVSVKIVNNYSIELTSTIKKDASDSSKVYSNVLIDADILVGKTITMSYDEWNSNVPNETAVCGIIYNINGKNYYEHLKDSRIKTVTIPLGAKDCKVRLFLIEGVSTTVKAGTYTAIIKGLMICEGTVAKSWEPCTGGKPSPSPDYPQEIQNALGNLTVRGKNLYDQTIQWVTCGWSGTIRNTQNKVTVTAKNGWINASFLSPAKGETVTFSCTYKQIETTSEDTNQAFCIATTPNGQYPNQSNGVTCYETSSPSTKETTVSATFVSDAYIGIFLRVKQEGIGLTRTVELTNIQLEYGSEATSYEPYHTPQTLSTQNGLPGIMVTSGGNYTDENGQQWICDEVDFERGVYRQRIKHVNVVFKKGASSSTHSGYRHMAGDIQNMSREHTECLCNIATHSQNAAYGTEGVRASGAYNALVLYYENLTLDNVPADVAYILSDPIETPLSETDIAAYRALTIYDPTTVVETNSGGLKVSYNKIVKKLVEERSDLPNM